MNQLPFRSAAGEYHVWRHAESRSGTGARDLPLYSQNDPQMRAAWCQTQAKHEKESTFFERGTPGLSASDDKFEGAPEFAQNLESP